MIRPSRLSVFDDHTYKSTEALKKVVIDEVTLYNTVGIATVLR